MRAKAQRPEDSDELRINKIGRRLLRTQIACRYRMYVSDANYKPVKTVACAFEFSRKVMRTAGKQTILADIFQSDGQCHLVGLKY